VSRHAHGLRAWLLQRATAVYLAVFTLYLVFHFTTSAPATYQDWRAWVASPPVNTALGLALGALMLHAWVGMRDIVMDYFRATGLRLAMLAAVALVLAASGLWAARVLLLAGGA